MTKLQSDDLTLDIKFIGFKDEWIEYEIKFYWNDDLIINDSILKRNGEFWGKRSNGAFLANDYQKDFLIETIRDVLQTNKPEYWEPLEPDAIMAIYPGMFFPFLKSHLTFIEEETEEKEHEENEKKKQKKGKQPADPFTIITFIDSYTFKNNRAYSGEGISLHLIVTRENLEKFANELEIEYRNLRS
jgi:hypothetical protein